MFSGSQNFEVRTDAEVLTASIHFGGRRYLQRCQILRDWRVSSARAKKASMAAAKKRTAKASSSRASSQEEVSQHGPGASHMAAAI